MKIERLTVGKLKQILQAYKVPDDAIVCCQSDEEGNREMVCMDVFVDRVGRKESTCYQGQWYEVISGHDVLGLEKEDEGKIYITFRPMY